LRAPSTTIDAADASACFLRLRNQEIIARRLR
jgi:hypothetical protein